MELAGVLHRGLGVGQLLEALGAAVAERRGELGLPVLVLLDALEFARLLVRAVLVLNLRIL